MGRSIATAAAILAVGGPFACGPAGAEPVFRRPHGRGDVAKQVVNTQWWPPGTETTAESVGILSHHFVFMTGMMEVKTIPGETANAELMDVADIAAAAGTSLDQLVDCLANAPAGGARVVRQALEKTIAEKTSAPLPSLTVVEVPGEYWVFNSSVACIAALPGAPKKVYSTDARTYGVAAWGLLHLSAISSSFLQAVASIGKLVILAGGNGIDDVAECTVFLADILEAAALRAVFATAVGKGMAVPALTIVQGGLEENQQVAARCVASIGANAETRLLPFRSQSEEPKTRRAGHFAFVSGQFAHMANGTDGLDALAVALASAGLGLADVVNCLFVVKDQTQMMVLFSGFYEVFNRRHPPPPARDELVAPSECGSCALVVRCVAAFPVAAGQPIVDQLLLA